MHRNRIDFAPIAVGAALILLAPADAALTVPAGLLFIADGLGVKI